MTQGAPVGSPAEAEMPSAVEVDPNSGLMLRLLTAWIALVALVSFVTVPWLKPANQGDFTEPMIWFYHALMIPTVALFLILCLRIFRLRPWVNVVVGVGGMLDAALASIGCVLRGYGELYNVPSLSSFGIWVLLPGTLVMTLVVAVFVVGLGLETARPMRGSRASREITWALFLAGLSGITWVAMGMVYAASEVNISWAFWAHWQGESISTFLANIATSHSHGMLPSFMAGIVILAAEAFGYSVLGGARKQVARLGVGVMLVGIALYSGVYLVSGIGTYAIPAWFPSGPGGVNGIAMDDSMTGLVGIGALILAGAMLPEVRLSFRRAGSKLRDRLNPVRASVYLTYVMAAGAMFFYGFWIEMNEAKFGFNSLPASGAIDDQIFTRSHLLFVFGSLPIIAVFLLATEIAGDTSGIGSILRKWMSGSIIAGMFVTLLGMGIWVFSTPGHQLNWGHGSAGEVIYIVGQALIVLGAFIGLFTMRSASSASNEDRLVAPPEEAEVALVAQPS